MADPFGLETEPHKERTSFTIEANTVPRQHRCKTRLEVHATPSRRGRRSPKTPASELKAERELQVALALSGRAAAFRENFAKGLGIGRIETDIGSAVAAAIGAPIRMVPHVVGLGAELEAEPFVDGNGFE